MDDGAGERRRQHPRATSFDDGRWRWRTTAATSQGTVVGRWPMALANDGGNIPGHRRWTMADGAGERRRQHPRAPSLDRWRWAKAWIAPSLGAIDTIHAT